MFAYGIVTGLVPYDLESLYKILKNECVSSIPLIIALQFINKIIYIYGIFVSCLHQLGLSCDSISIYCTDFPIQI